MRRLVVLLALLVLAETEHLLGVNYSFDIDFYRNFDSKRCDQGSMWELVKYGSLYVEPPFANSDRAIRASEESCTSSFPIIFVGGVLDIDVYAQVISSFFKLSIEVFDEHDTCVKSYVYRKSSKGFGPGWRTISLKINKHIKGYIHLRGSSLSNEMLLIDSFRYTPNNTINYDHRRAKRSVIHQKEDETEIIFHYKLDENLNKYDSFESSGDGEDVNDPPIEKPNRILTFWNPFTIALVSIGGVVVITLVIVSAYHCGKLGAMRYPPLPVEDVEPPRTMIIPRVAGTSNRNPRYLEY